MFINLIKFYKPAIKFLKEKERFFFMIESRTHEIKERLENLIKPLFEEKHLEKSKAREIFSYINNPEIKSYWDNYGEIASRFSMNYDAGQEIIRLWEKISIEKTKLAIATRMQMNSNGDISSYKQARASGEEMISGLKELSEIEKVFLEKSRDSKT